MIGTVFFLMKKSELYFCKPKIDVSVLLKSCSNGASEQKPADFDGLLKQLAEMGCEVSRRGQTLAMRAGHRYLTSNRWRRQ
jgi:hypothetical protein